MRPVYPGRCNASRSRLTLEAVADINSCVGDAAVPRVTVVAKFCVRGMVRRGEEPPVRGDVHADRDGLAEQPRATEIEPVAVGFERPVMDGAAEDRLDEIAIEHREIPGEPGIDLIDRVVARRE